ncbi:MAG: ATP-dependent Clp protease proteolytic subunit [Ruminococcus sp.]|nr:ATP-dependent Clp protease proteolytic subunit [Ruminococcus sp.]
MDEERVTAREGGVTAAGGRHNICCLNVIGQVEGHYLLPPDTKTTKYEHIIPSLAEVELSGEYEGLLILLNTAGGDVEAGLAIAELISGMQTPSASVVLGGGHSIGVPLAVCAKRSFIVPSASMTIHPVRLNGPVIGVEQTVEYFQRMQRRIDRFITDNSEISSEKLRELMLSTDELVNDIGTVIDGRTAVEYGLIDRLGGIHDAVEWLYSEIEKEK